MNETSSDWEAHQHKNSPERVKILISIRSLTSKIQLGTNETFKKNPGRRKKDDENKTVSNSRIPSNNT